MSTESEDVILSPVETPDAPAAKTDASTSLLNAHEKQYLADLKTAIDAGEVYDPLVTDNKTLIDIIAKEPHLVPSLVAIINAEIQYRNNIEEPAQATTLEGIKASLVTTFKATDAYKAFKATRHELKEAEKARTRMSTEEQDLLLKIGTAIQTHKDIPELVSKQDVLIAISQRKEGIISALVASVNTAIKGVSEGSDEEHNLQRIRHVLAAVSNHTILKKAPPRKPDPRALTDEQKELLEETEKKINSGEYPDNFNATSDVILAIGRKRPELLVNLLHSAKDAYNEGSGDLEEEDYKKYQRILRPILRDVGYKSKKELAAEAEKLEAENKPREPGELPLAEEISVEKQKQQLVKAIAKAIKNGEPCALLSEDHETLKLIADNDPLQLFNLMTAAETQGHSYDPNKEKSTNNRQIAKQLRDTLAAYEYEPVLNPPVIIEQPRHTSRFRARLQGFTAGMLATGAAAGGTALWLANDDNAAQKVSNVTRHVNVPLTDKDRILAILENPAKLEKITLYLGSEQGVDELVQAMKQGDANSKAEAIAKLSKAISESLGKAAETRPALKGAAR